MLRHTVKGARVAYHTYHSIAREMVPAIANMVSDRPQLRIICTSQRNTVSRKE